MPHQDQLHLRKNEQSIKDVLERVLPERIATFQRHGNATLEASWLVEVALICWGWTSQGTLSDRVALACEVVGRVERVKTTVSRQGLLKALSTNGEALIQLMIDHLAATLSHLKGDWTRGGKVNVAVDGTKLKAPRTAANQQAFAVCARSKNRNGQRYKDNADASKAVTVQLLVTLFWHLGTGLPLRWKVAGSAGSERKTAQEILDQLPANTRLIGDAEYVGYPLWSTIIDSNRSFLFRVGSNVKLLKNLGRYRWQDGYVYFWPDRVMNRDHPPLVLRLFEMHNGKNRIFLVTNELEMSEQLAIELYKARWGVEVFFRTIKQSCQRSKLCCGQPQNVLSELNWTLLGIWIAIFHGKENLTSEGLPPRRLSPVKVMRAFTLISHCIHRQATNSPLLSALLREAVIVDESTRTTSKQSHNYPRKKRHHSCGPPTITTASKTQIHKAKKYET